MRENAAGQSNVNTLAVMPLVACLTPSAAHHALCSRSRYDSACRFAVANSPRRSMAAKRTGSPVPARPVLIPFLRTVYSVAQFRNAVTNPGGHCGLPAPCNAPFAQGVSTMGFHSLRTAVLFGLVALALLANGRKAIAAAQTAPPASPTVALSASPASAQAGQPVTLKWSSTNATS